MKGVKRLSAFTIETAPEEYKYLFERPLYKICKKGAGHRKFWIHQVRMAPADTNCDSYVDVHIVLKSNYVSKTTFIKERFSIKQAILYPSRGVMIKYFATVLQYFLYMEDNTRPTTWSLEYMRRSKQYKFELNNIRKKYPEYWL